MTIDQIIRALGGATSVCQRLGSVVTRQAIDDWRRRNVIPAAHRSGIIALCVADNLPLPKFEDRT